MEPPCVKNSDCGSRQWCEAGTCTCFGWTGSTGPPECRGASPSSYVVSAVALGCVVMSTFFFLLHVLVLIQKALFSRHVALRANQKGKVNATPHKDPESLLEAGGAEGQRRSSVRQRLMGGWKRGGGLLTHKGVFHVCSLVACVTRIVIEGMRFVMPLGHLNVRQLTYSPLAPLNFLECLYSCATFLWAVVLAVIWVDTAVAAGLREPRMWCGSSTFTFMLLFGVCMGLVLCGAVYTMQYWVASLWAIFMGFSVSRAYVVGLQALVANEPNPPPTLRQSLAARIRRVFRADPGGLNLAGDEEEGAALACYSHSNSKPSTVAPAEPRHSPVSSDNPLLSQEAQAGGGPRTSHSAQRGSPGPSPRSSAAPAPGDPIAPTIYSGIPSASRDRKQSGSTASSEGAGEKEREKEREGTHSSGQRRRLVLQSVARLAHKIVSYFSLGGFCHVVFGFLYSNKVTAHYALIFWMVGNLCFLVANFAALYFLSRWLRFIMFRCCRVKQRDFAQEQVQARMMRIEPEQKRPPRQE